MKDVIKKLLDEDNLDDIKLFVDNEEILFEQIANVAYEGELYTILVPKQSVKGCEEGEAILFQFVNVNDDIEVEIVSDDNLIDAVYNEYLKMI